MGKSNMKSLGLIATFLLLVTGPSGQVQAQETRHCNCTGAPKG